LKSGSNNIHGTAFGFGRDGVTDARNYFNTAPTPSFPAPWNNSAALSVVPLLETSSFSSPLTKGNGITWAIRSAA
jgi:hypothetical protein